MSPQRPFFGCGVLFEGVYPVRWRFSIRIREAIGQKREVCSAADAVQFARERLQWEPDEVQRKILESDAKRGILLCSRQWGKSTVIAAKTIHVAATQPGALILVAAPTERQSGEFLGRIEEMMANAGMRVRRDRRNKHSVVFENRSRVVGLAGRAANLRGFSGISLLVIDEAAWVSDAMYSTLRPMLAVKGGALWMLSTAGTKRGFFYETWTHGGAGWFRLKATGPECPRITAEFLEEEMMQQPQEQFRQEYLCEFADVGHEVFDRGLIERAIDHDEKSLNLRRKW